jgi:hypothetical protein
VRAAVDRLVDAQALEAGDVDDVRARRVDRQVLDADRGAEARAGVAPRDAAVGALAHATDIRRVHDCRVRRVDHEQVDAATLGPERRPHCGGRPRRGEERDQGREREDDGAAQ